MATVIEYLVDLISKINGHKGILLIELILLLWDILGLDPLELVAIELENLTVVLGLDHTIWKLTMEQLGPLRET